jgi:hypothetical protein
LYDIIGDVHGYCSKLKELLIKLGYEDSSGVWRHEERKVIFVGDYIDRGPEIRETLQLVKNMTDADAAIAVMGNHEYNALAYAYPLTGGGYLRSHNKMHERQHEATVLQFANYPEEWQEYLEWFYTLPLFLDLPGIRVVHACWDDEHISWLKTHNHLTLSEGLLFASHERGSLAYRVINDTLKGKEFNIPENYTWYDKDGHARNSNRVKWWVNPAAKMFGDFLFNCPPALMEQIAREEVNVSIYPADAVPVFFGHYWLEDKFPVIQSENVICLDYSVAKEGALVAYRWNGEQKVINDHFVFVK